jgi:hypothetical protein
MPLKAEEVLTTLKRGGWRVAALSILSALALGVIDQFTSRIIPSIAEHIDHYFNPPRFFIIFTPPLDDSVEVTVSLLDLENAKPITIKRAQPSRVNALAGTGAYEVRLHRQRNQVRQELVDVKTIEKSDQTWPVDTTDRNWANAAELVSGAPSIPTTQDTSSQIGVLRNTRWTAAEGDFAVLVTLDDPIGRSVVANGLAEVGLYENGTDREKRRILSYWEAVGPPWTDQVSTDNVQKYPWGGAFLAWTLKQAGAVPPIGAPAFKSWLTWGDEVTPSVVAPGMVAIFKLRDTSELSEAVSRLLVGLVLRSRPDCIEIIAGNIADRVVITCVALNRLIAIRRLPT